MKFTFDSRKVEPGMGFVALKGEKVDGRDFIDAAKAAGAVRIINGLGELHAAALEKRRSLKAKVIGVTGSSGKTTTKEFLRVFLNCPATEGNFNNHIGLPMTILNCPDDAEFLVVEMGTNHPGEIATLCDIAEPDIGVLVSLGSAHMEHFGSKEAIANEKTTLLKRAKDLSFRWDEVESAPFECPLPGVHNKTNMSLAYAVARALGVSQQECEERLNNFSLPGERWREVEKWGVKFIDDSYNANPESMKAAIDAFAEMKCSGHKTLVLGDMFELGENALEKHREVFEYAMKFHFKLVIGVGEMSSRCLCNLVYKNVATLKKKFRLDVSAGDLVLLKASHSMHLSDLIKD
ncbi:MAG: hypothetical protein J6S51_05840 [Kiritimatiellae bacterium]|nr:hypothetical protein [Kiritimatiellia bacterium]